MTLWPMARISVGDDSMITFEEHAGLALIRKHKAFTLNVPDATWVDQFDRIDMTASTKARPDAPMQPPPGPSRVQASTFEHSSPLCACLAISRVESCALEPGVSAVAGRQAGRARAHAARVEGDQCPRDRGGRRRPRVPGHRGASPAALPVRHCRALASRAAALAGHAVRLAARE